MNHLDAQGRIGRICKDHVALKLGFFQGAGALLRSIVHPFPDFRRTEIRGWVIKNYL